MIKITTRNEEIGNAGNGRGWSYTAVIVTSLSDEPQYLARYLVASGTPINNAEVEHRIWQDYCNATPIIGATARELSRDLGER